MWPVIAQAVTGTRNAYIRTETGWWLQSVGNDEFIPLTPWFRQAATHLGVIGPFLVIALMVGFAMLLWSRSVRRLGIVIVSFAFSYGLYLFAVFLPQQSTFRLMVPLSPLLGDERLSKTRKRRTAIIAGCIALQTLCVWVLWTVNHP
jgi:drug/metabolite transporter (DMT)-like permease